MTDCLIIGFNDYNFDDYVAMTRAMDESAGAFRDLNLAFVEHDGKPYRALDMLTHFYYQGKGEPVRPFHNADFLWPVITYLGTYLSRKGFSFDYINLFHLQKSPLEEKLRNDDVLTIAITTTLYVSPHPIMEIISFIRERNASAKIILGGPYIANQIKTSEPEEAQKLFKYFDADVYIISQEGEASLAMVVDAHKNGGDFDNIPNIAFRKNGGYTFTQQAPEDNPLAENLPDYSLFPASDIGGFMSTRTSKSCPFSCAFCGFPKRAGKYRYLPVEDVERELDAIAKAGVHTLTILDDTFNVPKKRFKDILRMMIKNRYGFKWNSFYRVDHGDEEAIALMRDAGCEGVFLGVESGSDEILSRMNKTSRRADYLKAIPLLKAAGIITYASLVVGFPGETRRTFDETLELVEAAAPDFFRAQLWYCDPMTDVYQKKDEYKIRGQAFNWSHATMDSRIACDLIEEMLLSVENSIWLPQNGFELWSLFYLQRRGMAFDQVKNFIRCFDDIVKHKILHGQKPHANDALLLENLKAAARFDERKPDGAEKRKVLIFDRSLIEEKKYWNAKLKLDINASNINQDYPRPAAYSGALRTHAFAAPESVSQKVIKLAGKSDFLIYVALMAALKVCVHKHSGGDTTVTGSPARKTNDTVNALAIVDTLDPALSFKQYLMKTRETLLETYTRQNYPYDYLLRDLGLASVDNKCPLFDIALAMTSVHSELPAVKNDMTITFARTGAGLTGEARFNADIYAPDTVESFISHYMNLLDDALDDPERPLSRLSMASAAEQQKILLEWQGETRESHTNRLLIPAFETMANSHPDAVAIIHEKREITYRSLDELANRLARRLRADNLAKGSLVALMAERSPEMIVAILAVFKAGLAYVPIDPDYPEDRIRYMIEDAAPSVILADHSADGLIAGLSLKVIRLDEDCSAHVPDPINLDLTPDDLAYIIYTSGSTGKPKGVMVSHGGLVNLAMEQIKAFGVRPGSRVLQFASFSFDASVSEIAMALLSGATLCVCPADATMPGKNLTETINNLKITHITLPPSTLPLMSPDDLPTLESLVLAGETCPADVATRWAKGRRLFNAYGPTEYTVCATIYEYDAAISRFPIGRPIANTKVYILDPDMNLTAPGVKGEMYIGGAGLAKGYHGRPDLTAERFVKNPFSDAGDYLYRTGDVARYLPDGNIEYLGRIDHQVKIRGYRIELGEVEATLASHQNVETAAVIAREDKPGDTRLVAYVAGDFGDETGDDLRAYVRHRLPDYMLPSAIVFLDEMPLTPNGKIDRKALPAPATSGTRKNCLPPRDPVEFELVKIWEDVLDSKPVGVADNFFDLGGHSLLAVRLMARVSQDFGKSVSLSEFFRNATVERLAGLIRDGGGAMEWSAITELISEGAKSPLFIVHPAGGTVMCYLELAKLLNADRPVYAIQARGIEKNQTPVRDIENMATAYILEVKKIQPDGPYNLAGWSFGGVAAFEMAAQLRAGGDGVSFLGLIDTYAPSTLPETLGHMDDARHLANLFAGEVPLSVDFLRTLRSEEQLAHVVEQAGKYNLIPSGFGLDDAMRLLDVYKTNSAAIYNYTPKKYDGEVVVIRANEKVSDDAYYSEDPALGWNEHVTAGVRVKWVNANHQNIIKPPFVGELAAHIRACLEEN